MIHTAENKGQNRYATAIFLLFSVVGLFFSIRAAPVGATPSHLEPVTLQLRWVHQFQFAGYYAAIEKGFYGDEGLQV